MSLGYYNRKRNKTLRDEKKFSSLIASPFDLGTETEEGLTLNSFSMPANGKLGISFSESIGSAQLYIDVSGRIVRAPALAADEIYPLGFFERGKTISGGLLYDRGPDITPENPWNSLGTGWTADDREITHTTSGFSRCGANSFGFDFESDYAIDFSIEDGTTSGFGLTGVLSTNGSSNSTTFFSQTAPPDGDYLEQANTSSNRTRLEFNCAAWTGKIILNSVKKITARTGDISLFFLDDWNRASLIASGDFS